MQTKDIRPITGRLGLSGTFECRDAEGNILKTIEFTGSLPIDLSNEEGADDGADDSE